MDHSFPTSADYAYSAANDARQENESLRKKLKALEERVKRLEKLAFRTKC